MKREVTDQDIRWAREKLAVWKAGPRYLREMDKGDNVLVGYIGDAVFKRRYPHFEHVDTPDADFIGWGGKKIDVKTSLSNGAPRGYYWRQIPLVDMARKPDVYVFVMLNRGWETAYIVGRISRSNFKERAVTRLAGTIRPGLDPFVFRSDTCEVMVRDLDKIF